MVSSLASTGNGTDSTGPDIAWDDSGLVRKPCSANDTEESSITEFDFDNADKKTVATRTLLTAMLATKRTWITTATMPIIHRQSHLMQLRRRQMATALAGVHYIMIGCYNSDCGSSVTKPIISKFI
jgi:hypothetical protein